MNVILLLLLGSLSLILVSALEAPSSQGVLAQTRLARDTNDSKKERRIKRRKSRRKKSNGKKDKEAKSRVKSRGRKKGRKVLKRNKDKKKKSKNNKKYNNDNSRNKRKKKRRKSKGKKKKNKGKSSISNPRSLVSPVPVPTPSPTTGCPICPNCDATIIEKANGFKKAQNWLRQCKRIKSQTTVIGNKFGKAGDFMDAAKYLNMTTMGGTFCADGDSLANATATMTTLNECMASIEAACTCSTSVKQETKPPSSTSAAPTTAAATTSAPTTSACPDKETTLKGIIDSYQVRLNFS